MPPKTKNSYVTISLTLDISIMQGNPALTGKCCHVNEMLIWINRLCSVLSVCFSPNSHRLLLPLCAPYKDRMSEEIKHSPRGIQKEEGGRSPPF